MNDDSYYSIAMWESNNVGKCKDFPIYVAML